MISKTQTSLVALALGCMFASPAMAQGQHAASAQADTSMASEGSLLGEIVVTAQKRDERLQDVGIAINAFSGSQLRALGVTDSRAIASLSPGVFLGGSLGGQNSQYTIRGVTQNEANDIVEGPNAVYLDEGYIAIGQGQTFALFDIERVEVLKGPQGTLFGRNATGGLVHFITVKPSLDRVKGFVDLQGGLYDSRSTPGIFRGEAALNLPLGEKMAARGAVMWNKGGAFIRNIYPVSAVGPAPGPGAGANSGAEDTLSGRLTLLFEPSDTVSFTLSGNIARTINSTPPYQSKATIPVFNADRELIDTIDASANETRASIGPNGADFGADLDNDGVYGGAPFENFTRPVPGGDYFGWKDPDGKGVLTSTDFAFSRLNRIRTHGINLTGGIEISDGVTFTTVSDYKNYEKTLFTDVDTGPVNQSANAAFLDAWQASQEFRLNGTAGPLTWVAGLYYLHIDAQSAQVLKFPAGSVTNAGPIDLTADARLKTDSYSAFGQVGWDFADKLRLIVGGRVIREQKDYFYFQGLYFAPDARKIRQGDPIILGPITSQGSGPYTQTTGQTLWTGKAQLEYRPNADLLLYAGVNRGIKAGSFNAPIPGGLPYPESAISYKPEKLLSVEGGFKYSFPDGRTRLNASIYHYDYKDYQAYLFAGVSAIVINADQTNTGAEAEFFTSPMRGLDLGLNISYFQATVKDLPLRVNGPIIRDVRPTYAPRLQGSALVRYEWEALGRRLSVGSDATYSSSFYYNLRNFQADKFGRYVMVNANMSYLKGPMQYTFSVKNVTDVRAGVQGFDLAGFSGANEVAYRAPRLFQLGVRYTF